MAVTAKMNFALPAMVDALCRRWCGL